MSNARRGLFLDFDGTLADTVPMLRQTYFRFLESHGHQGSDEEFASLKGPRLHEVAAILKDKYGLEPDVDDLVRRYRELIHEFYFQAEPMTGARAVMEQAHRAGWAVAVVTSASEKDVGQWLAQNGLDSFVETVVGSESVTRGKPDGEPYRTALERCGCDVADAIAIEDSPTGAASAVAAGINTFVIGPEPADAGDWPNVSGFIQSFEPVAKLMSDV